MTDPEKQSIEKIIENANQNRNELIEMIETKIVQLGMILTEIQETIKHYLEMAKKYDVRYIADKNIQENISQYIDNLGVVRQILVALDLSEENIFEEDKYLKNAQRLLDLLNDSNLAEKKDNFIKSNRDRFEDACKQKREVEMELANLEIELEGLKGEKAELNQENAQIQVKIDKIKLRLLKKQKIEKNLSSNTELIKDIDERIKTLNGRIKELERKQIKNHFIQNQEEEACLEREETKEEIELGEE